MITNRQLFFSTVAQTSKSPLAFEVVKAEGIYMYGPEGEKCIDLISGISVSNLGHCNKRIVEAVKKQAETYMYLMVYGEFVQAPQVQLAKLLTSVLPENLNNVYFVNSGSEANEGAIKLAKRYTSRTEVISFKNCYHGSTQGVLSIIGNEKYKNAFRPLIPDTRLLEFNNFNELEFVSEKTACVIVEPVQGEAGVVLPQEGYLKALRERCNSTNTLLIFDEVQTGFGRTGSLFGHRTFNVIPDIITFAKGFGGGMPLGAFVSSKEIMDCLTHNPILGHITTYGGHPVSCAAALESLKILLEEDDLIKSANKKGEIFLQNLKHPKIDSVHGIGLFICVTLKCAEDVPRIVQLCLKRGVLIDYFLFNENSFRISPPLIITEEQIEKSCAIILDAFEEIN